MKALVGKLVRLGVLFSLVGCGPDAGQKALDLALAATGFEIEPLLAQQADDGVVIRRVWEGTEPDFWSATASPDGRYVSETDWETGDLAVTDLVTGELKRVTDKGSWFDKVEWAETSVFSPDGRQLAYTYWNEDRAGYEIRVIGLDGSGERTIVPSPGPNFYAMLEDWSDDGRYLLAMLWYEQGVMQIGLISVEDGSIRVLKETEERRGPDVCALSPDGRFMAYDPHPSGPSGDSENHDIVVMALEGGREVGLLTGPAHDRLLGWTPDGSAILFYSDRGLTEGIWMLPVSNGRATGEPTLLRGDVWRLEPIGFSRDAYYFGVTTQQPQVHTAVIDPRAGRLVTPPAAIEDPSQGRSWPAAWSPDGRQLAYVRASAGERNPKLILRSVTGDDSREIPVPLDRPRSSDWTQDGQAVLIQARDSEEGGGWGIFKLHLKTGTAERVLRFEDLGEAVNVRSVQFSPDEKTIFFARWGEGYRSGTIVARDRASGREREIAAGKVIQRLSLAPDGKTLAFVEWDREAGFQQIATVSASGGQIEQLHQFDPEEFNDAAGLSWSPDGRHILYAARDGEADRYSLWRIPKAGGEPTRIAELPFRYRPNMRGLRFHPDGNRIAFISGEFRGEIWVVENLPGTRPIGETETSSR